MRLPKDIFDLRADRRPPLPSTSMPVDKTWLWSLVVLLLLPFEVVVLCFFLACLAIAAAFFWGLSKPSLSMTDFRRGFFFILVWALPPLADVVAALFLGRRVVDEANFL